MNEFAEEGQLFVCAACGKMSKDRYGDQKLNRGWDESCMLNCILKKYVNVDRVLRGNPIFY